MQCKTSLTNFFDTTIFVNVLTTHLTLILYFAIVFTNITKYSTHDFFSQYKLVVLFAFSWSFTNVKEPGDI